MKEKNHDRFIHFPGDRDARARNGRHPETLIGLNPDLANPKPNEGEKPMLTTIVCLVALVGNPACIQRIEFTLTQVQVEEIRQEYPRQDLKTAVCSHLNRAVQLGSEE
jgi:hypothetical protein